MPFFIQLPILAQTLRYTRSTGEQCGPASTGQVLPISILESQILPYRLSAGKGGIIERQSGATPDHFAANGADSSRAKKNAQHRDCLLPRCWAPGRSSSCSTPRLPDDNPAEQPTAIIRRIT